MHGSPLFRIGVIGILLALAGIPVFLLTRERTREQLPPREAATAARDVELTIVSTPAALVELRHQGHVIAASREPSETLRETLRLPAGSPADLVVRVQWPGASSVAAVRFLATEDGELLADASFWGPKAVEDVLTIPKRP